MTSQAKFESLNRSSNKTKNIYYSLCLNLSAIDFKYLKPKCRVAITLCIINHLCIAEFLFIFINMTIQNLTSNCCIYHTNVFVK